MFIIIQSKKIILKCLINEIDWFFVLAPSKSDTMLIKQIAIGQMIINDFEPSIIPCEITEKEFKEVSKILSEVFKILKEKTY